MRTLNVLKTNKQVDSLVYYTVSELTLNLFDVSVIALTDYAVSLHLSRVHP